MSHSVRRHLRLDLTEYDASIRRFIPGYEGMIAKAADEVVRSTSGRVLDLGAGTGALSAAVLERSAQAHVELLDVDPEMLDRARRRLQEFGARVSYTLGSFDAPLPRCDAAMASLSLHHVPTPEAKLGLFARVAEALPIGGVLVNADVTMPALDPERKDAWHGWAEHLVACGIPEDEAWRHFEEWAEEDTYFPLDEELGLYAEAGFDAECVWCQGVSTVVVARRRGDSSVRLAAARATRRSPHGSGP